MSYSKIFYAFNFDLKKVFSQKNRLLIIFSMLVLWGLPGCSQNKIKRADFLSWYGGDPYMGTVKVAIILPDGSTAKTDRGEGSAYFKEMEKGKAQMIVFGAIDNKKGDAGFTAEGPYKGKAWKSDGKGITITIDSSGKITGGGNSTSQEINFSGTVSAENLTLVTRVKEQKKTNGGLPAGTTFVFTYYLSRAGTAAESTTRNSTAKKKCKKIVWVSQYIGHFDGSGSTIRVPKCMD